MDPKSNAMPVNTSEEEMELKEGEDLSVRCKRTKFSVSTVQPQQGVEVSDMKNKVPRVLLHKVSAGKDPMNTNAQAGAMCTGLPFYSNQTARSRLHTICRSSGWKTPLYDFEEQGPPHNKLFWCKVTVLAHALSSTVLECFSGPKKQKKAAQEHAAQGAVWCLAHFEHK